MTKQHSSTLKYDCPWNTAPKSNWLCQRINNAQQHCHIQSRHEDGEIKTGQGKKEPRKTVGALKRQRQQCKVKPPRSLSLRFPPQSQQEAQQGGRVSTHQFPLRLPPSAPIFKTGWELCAFWDRGQVRAPALQLLGPDGKQSPTEDSAGRRTSQASSYGRGRLWTKVTVPAILKRGADNLHKLHV